MGPQVHVEGSLVPACPDGARQGFEHFKVMQWREGPLPDHKNKYNHQYNFAAFAHSTHHVKVLGNFFCGNLWQSREGGSFVFSSCHITDSQTSRLYLSLSLQSFRLYSPFFSNWRPTILHSLFTTIETLSLMMTSTNSVEGGGELLVSTC